MRKVKSDLKRLLKTEIVRCCLCQEKMVENPCQLAVFQDKGNKLTWNDGILCYTCGSNVQRAITKIVKKDRG